MLSIVKELSKLGPRNADAEGDLASEEFIIKWLNNLGYEIRRISCSIGVFKPRKISFKLVSPYEKEIPAEFHFRSGSTPKIKTELSYLGLGEKEDFVGASLDGKVVLFEPGGVHPVEKVMRAYNNGAVACILPHYIEGGDIGSWGLNKWGAPLGVIGVSYENFKLLKNLQNKGKVSLEIEALCSTIPGKQNNLIFIKKGRGNPEETVLFVAHRDTVHVSSGANDNASGIAVLLELARILKSVELPINVKFILTGAEEGGGFGIEELIEKNPQEISNVKSAINIDMVGSGTELCVVTSGYLKGRKVFTDKKLNSLIKKIGAGNGFKLNEWDCPYGLADTGPLMKRGISSSWLYRLGDKKFHTPKDLPSEVKKEYLFETLMILKDFLFENGAGEIKE